MAKPVFRRVVEFIAATALLGFCVSIFTPIRKSWETLLLVGSVVVFALCVRVLLAIGRRVSSVELLNKPDQRL